MQGDNNNVSPIGVNPMLIEWVCHYWVKPECDEYTCHACIIIAKGTCRCLYITNTCAYCLQVNNGGEGGQVFVCQ